MTKETLVEGKTFKMCAPGFQGRVSAFGETRISLYARSQPIVFSMHTCAPKNPVADSCKVAMLASSQGCTQKQPHGGPERRKQAERVTDPCRTEDLCNLNREDRTVSSHLIPVGCTRHHKLISSIPARRPAYEPAYES